MNGPEKNFVLRRCKRRGTENEEADTVRKIAGRPQEATEARRIAGSFYSDV